MKIKHGVALQETIEYIDSDSLSDRTSDSFTD